MSMQSSKVALDRLRILNPVARAFALGYLTTTLPKLISLLKTLRRRDVSTAEKLQRLIRILHCGFKWDRFPVFCALLAGGSSILPRALEVVRLRFASSGYLQSLPTPLSIPLSSDRPLRFLAAFLSALICFPILNRTTKHPYGRSAGCDERVSSYQPSVAKKNQDNGNGSQNNINNRPDLAGRTLDLTLFATTRAADALVNVLWSRWKASSRAQGNGNGKAGQRVRSLAPKLADTGVFAISSAIVMWAWFYLPDRLPYSYGKWISEAAQLDNRILEALRTARRGDWTYGRDNGDQVVLESMCVDYGWPIEWGTPEKTVPIPCEIVHMGCGPNCEKTAVWRFARAFKFACATYLPLQIVMRCRSRNLKTYIHATKSALRSSTFLGLFVSLFYYSVCLARTRLGPRLFSSKTVTPMMWDSGLCIAAGCAMCGWSIFVESTGRRQEISLFVAPRALATLLPREYDRKYQWRERLAFSLSTAILVACIHENPKLVRGVFGKFLARVFKT
ncbi:integral membrane protein [Nannizzia gypsea CBS 118893]|uniref:Integral membrane protein n=1 Tax=Arthroderma gypseum (strain ATCC MYA-4604 / CBS 118893) TaxID=535722 RepID=E4UR61_ARTGP|nr:integral membrane protein [Nannizzia gypsea CBS 118893]EFQ99336.1 integral membrane protein [Nannizzia gypsea CBS 118893]